ncbi:hypothetical protein C8R44DRAFT_976149 [Mycena epipterygia]|nr:hypothetical protein C8R44DRAFT_976149 [Mycena epipterygia]
MLTTKISFRPSQTHDWMAKLGDTDEASLNLSGRRTLGDEDEPIFSRLAIGCLPVDDAPQHMELRSALAAVNMAPRGTILVIYTTIDSLDTHQFYMAVFSAVLKQFYFPPLTVIKSAAALIYILIFGPSVAQTLHLSDALTLDGSSASGHSAEYNGLSTISEFRLLSPGVIALYSPPHIDIENKKLGLSTLVIQEAHLPSDFFSTTTKWGLSAGSTPSSEFSSTPLRGSGWFLSLRHCRRILKLEYITSTDIKLLRTYARAEFVHEKLYQSSITIIQCFTTRALLSLVSLVFAAPSFGQVQFSCFDSGAAFECPNFSSAFCQSIENTSVNMGDIISRCFNGPTQGLRCMSDGTSSLQGGQFVIESFEFVIDPDTGACDFDYWN